MPKVSQQRAEGGCKPELPACTLLALQSPVKPSGREMATVVISLSLMIHLESCSPVQPWDSGATKISETPTSLSQLTKRRYRGKVPQHVNGQLDTSPLSPRASPHHLGSQGHCGWRTQDVASQPSGILTNPMMGPPGFWMGQGVQVSGQAQGPTLFSPFSHAEELFEYAEAKETEGRRYRGLGRRSLESCCLGANPNFLSKTLCNEFTSPCLSLPVH